jgi:glycerol-3-phosphate acyltransferase PlsX
MEESPVAALRRKPMASIKVAAESVARGEASALFSAGHTGATVMAAYGAFGTLPGVDRPALAATIPNLPGLSAGKAFAVLCSGFACQPPVMDPAELQLTLRSALTKKE